MMLQSTLEVSRAALLETSAPVVAPVSAANVSRWAFFSNITLQGDRPGETMAYKSYNLTHTLMTGMNIPLLFLGIRLICCNAVLMPWMQRGATIMKQYISALSSGNVLLAIHVHSAFSHCSDAASLQ